MSDIVAIIPVKLREPLLYHTVNRLTKQGVLPVCVGHTISEKVVVEAAGGEFHMINEKGTTVAGKWQMALDKARKHHPKAVLYVGSGDWVSPRWCEVLYKHIERGCAMTGVIPAYVLHIHEAGRMEMGQWGGYTNYRRYETVGVGRLFSAKFLDMIKWKLFDIGLDMSIDYHQMKALQEVSPKWKGDLINVEGSDLISCLSISTYRWPNKHVFKNDVSNERSRMLDEKEMNKILKRDYPEAINLFNE